MKNDIKETIWYSGCILVDSFYSDESKTMKESILRTRKVY